MTVFISYDRIQDNAPERTSGSSTQDSRFIACFLEEGPWSGMSFITNPAYRLPIPAPPKRRVFVSYHHQRDQWWYDLFASCYSVTLDIFTNRSLQEPVDSDNTDYVHRVIRETNISGTSVTIVLCGPETWKRKWIDWEIGSTINKGHALLGIGLVTAVHLPGNKVLVPDRYYRNWLTGYAAWRYLLPTPEGLQAAIEEAIWRSQVYDPDKSLPFMTRNRP